MWQQIKRLLLHVPLLSAAATGERGEKLAAVYLQKKGYKVVARNWRNPRDRRDELDLICTDGEILVFVEVKTRDAGALVSGYHAVDTRKKKVVRRTAVAYMRRLRTRPHTYRFDIVEVDMSADGTGEVLHFENIDLFPKHFRP
ncbi:MAG: YraN family protein [Opitutaceae bacterium]|nr:YraN family protein [Opitutaceae bacterium]